MILDLFSHKIHSSGDTWPDKLAELAAIFGEFDGHIFDREAFEERLLKISPRASYAALEYAEARERRTRSGRMDLSKFRDEISAYPSYLGLYFLERSPRGWIVRMSNTAKKYLLREDPDVASFLRLQLPLFQYPNAMGAAYGANSRLRIQANARDRTLWFIERGIHFSPVRLIAVALRVDAALRGVELLDASISFREIFGLANSPDVNRNALPSQEAVKRVLVDIRSGRVLPPGGFESRFHILRHTELFVMERGRVKLREGVTADDKDQLAVQLEAIASIDNQFNEFDRCTSGADIEDVIASGEWGRYFDGTKILPSNTVTLLTSDQALEIPTPPAVPEPIIVRQTLAETYPFRERRCGPSIPRPYDRRRELADPELTRVKRQRRNLTHKEMIDKMDSYLRSLGANPKETDHIDLFAKIPRDGSFIFEMKSGGESLLEQIRKGLSQLYEYRFRYKEQINDDHVSLCLVLPESPSSIPWIMEYLCQDREINVCWFDENGMPIWPLLCEDGMRPLAP